MPRNVKEENMTPDGDRPQQRNKVLLKINREGKPPCISNMLLKKSDILRQNNNKFLIYILIFYSIPLCPMFFLFKIHSFKEINLLKKCALKKKTNPGFPGAHHPAAAGAVFGVV